MQRVIGAARPRARRRPCRRGRGRARPRRGRRARSGAASSSCAAAASSGWLVRSASAGPRHRRSASPRASAAPCGSPLRSALAPFGGELLEAVRVDAVGAQRVAAGGRGRSRRRRRARGARVRSATAARAADRTGSSSSQTASTSAPTLTGRPPASASRASSARSRPPEISTGVPSRSICSAPRMPMRTMRRIQAHRRWSPRDQPRARRPRSGSRPYRSNPRKRLKCSCAGPWKSVEPVVSSPRSRAAACRARVCSAVWVA